jgi:hypothetical protein
VRPASNPMQLGKTAAAAAIALLSAVAALLVSPVAAAQGMVTTCVKVTASRDDAKDLERLVKSEVARHPTHVVAEGDCRTRLEVELIEVKEGRFLTGRIGSQVPHRVRIEGKEGLVPALDELLRVVLHNDPITLEGPRRQSWLSGSVDQLRRKGQNLYGVEVFEWAAVLDGNVRQMPGVALRLRREIGAWHVGLRLAGALWPEPMRQGELEPALHIAAHAEVATFGSALADVSAYASALVGVEYQRFRGPAPLLGDGAYGSAAGTGLSFGLRGGVEVLRTTDMRFDLFVQALFPVFRTKDDDGGVMRQWVPSAMAGGGIAF